MLLYGWRLADDRHQYRDDSSCREWRNVAVGVIALGKRSNKRVDILVSVILILVMIVVMHGRISEVHGRRRLLPVKAQVQMGVARAHRQNRQYDGPDQQASPASAAPHTASSMPKPTSVLTPRPGNQALLSSAGTVRRGYCYRRY